MDALAGLVDDALARNLGSACALSVGDAGREVFRLVRGHDRRVPERGAAIDERAWFDVASLTKPIATVASAMVLVGDGRLDLDAPIRRFIANAASTGTVGQLIGHAAGCIAHVEFFRAMRGSEFAGVERDRRYRTLVDRAATTPANPPGVETIYSDLGYIQLGAIIERVVDRRLDDGYRDLVGDPLGLAARFPGEAALAGAVATEIDDARGGLVCGRVHDDNCYWGSGICGHAGLFATIEDVARFARAIVDSHAGRAVGRLRSEVVQRFARESAAPATSWRMGFDTPSPTPGVSQAGDRWPRIGAIGHTGFTGTSLWLDLPRRRWVVLLTNRVHPTRGGSSADDIKALRRAVHDAVVAQLDG